MPGGQFPAGQGERMAALLIVQAKIAAGLLPLGTVGIDVPASRAMMREQMREFVPQRAVHFDFTKCPETRVERDQ